MGVLVMSASKKKNSISPQSASYQEIGGCELEIALRCEVLLALRKMRMA